MSKSIPQTDLRSESLTLEESILLNLSEKNNRWNQEALKNPDSSIPRALRDLYQERTARIFRA